MNMYKEYKIKRIDSDIFSNEIWDSISSINIECFPWNENNYKPLTQVKMFYTKTHFHLYFKSFENNIRATFLQNHQSVCKDSCVEFFFKPAPQENDEYLNFEINPFGTMLLGLGEDRANRRSLQEVDSKLFNIKNSITTEFQKERTPIIIWNVTYSIPFSFIESYFGQTDFCPGYKVLGNFYKCGDETPYPHYGCWNPVHASAPDFHRPEYFGKITLC